MPGSYKNVNTSIMTKLCTRKNDMQVNPVMTEKLVKSDYLVLKFIYFYVY